MSKIILLDSIRSMQNVGAIFRNCDGAGFEKVILTGHTPTPPRRDISKTALGSETWIDWEYFSDMRDAVEQIQQQGYQIYCVELTEDARDYRELWGDNHERICLVVGNEISGVDPYLLDISDKNIIIPMRGNKESLNVSVAAGIVMYAL